ncbi:RHS repeat-associated core domain-containing protein, partial [Bacteroides thetaiotaomicron]|nr:RHS repeat-associated core domain-containing protein [Bacteroides thetaiotaomicron]
MNAEYGEGGSLLQNSGRFNEQVTGYDRVGNILGLKRYGQTTSTGYGLVDNLSLTYNGNQLKKVTDTATGSVYGNGFEFKNGANKDIEYEYDENGNLTKDLNKNMLDIQYNCLNLPSRIEFANGNTISYVYDASGMKLRTVHLINGVTTTADYCGNVVYENGVAKALLTEAGYITLSDNKYHYYLKDHQGNNRVVISQDGTTEEVNHYYPFGGLMSNSFANNVQPYKYNGKELDRKSDLDWYDYGARMYDAALGRWHIVDPRAEKYSALSPYVYCDNNPIRNLDLKGDSITVLNLGAGTNQHMAILIQNDAGKWQYFSVNGDNVYSSGSHTGGRKFDDIAVGEWDSPQLFMDSQYNSEGGKSDENSNSYGYSEGYIIPTTPEQDGIIREKFVNISRNESYDLLVNNCATAVQKSLESGGVKAYHHKRKNAQIRMIRSTSAFNLGAPKGGRSIIPSTAFQSIIIHNPKGKLIHK